MTAIRFKDLLTGNPEIVTSMATGSLRAKVTKHRKVMDKLIKSIETSPDEPVMLFAEDVYINRSMAGSTQQLLKHMGILEYMFTDPDDRFISFLLIPKNTWAAQLPGGKEAGQDKVSVAVNMAKEFNVDRVKFTEHEGDALGLLNFVQSLYLVLQRGPKGFTKAQVESLVKFTMNIGLAKKVIKKGVKFKSGYQLPGIPEMTLTKLVPYIFETKPVWRMHLLKLVFGKGVSCN